MHILWIPPPSVPRLIFDLFDDSISNWRAQGKMAYADEIEQTERRYLERANVVVAASSVLADRAQAVNLAIDVHWIPNGVDLTLFQQTTSAKRRY